MEERAVAEFLESASRGPSALLIDGEAGIGKTTLWSAALDGARGNGFQVLAARSSAAESVLAYATLAELLSEVDPQRLANLPHPQRAAVERIRQDGQPWPAPTEQRAVAAAFHSVIEHLAEDQPVLLAIDDLQWADPSSVHVLAYSARRLSEPVGILATVRTDDGGDTATSWLQLRRPDAIHRIALRPLPSRALHAVVTEHLGHPVSRAQMARIYQISGGNPFYAIELARALDETLQESLPPTLTEVVQARIAGLDQGALVPLLTAAACATPTVDLVAAATDADHERVVALLEFAEQQRVIVIEGNRIRFTHPLLAAGVYTGASPEQRRAVHRKLAEILDEPELRARHLALAATTGDSAAVAALENAATAAQARGAPAAAAELTELAIRLGGDTPERRIRLAAYCFDAGEPGRARELLEQVIAGLGPGSLRAEARHALAVARFVDDGYLEAARLLDRGLTEDDPEPATRVEMLIASAHALYNVGESDAAWERIPQAVAEAEQLGAQQLLSRALATRATLHFVRGDGMDETALRRAAELEDPNHPVPTRLQPSVLHALQRGWMGDLDAAYEQLESIRQRCRDRGEEGDLIFIDFNAALNRVWRGDFANASRIADTTTELAEQLGGEFPGMLALVVRASVAVYCAGDDDARSLVDAAIKASARSGTAWHDDWTLAALGFLETSLGNHAAAVAVLDPLITRLTADSRVTEVFAASFVSDAVESLVAVDRADTAEPLVGALERNAERLDRTWMRAVGGRCRAMLLAADGDLDAALAAAQDAMTHHDRLPMPFERARSQLFLGELQLRLRDPEAAITVQEALAVFENLATPRWAARAKAALPEVGKASTELTAAELRIAEMAASGMTNRDVARELFLSAKTVEATLGRVYRKLGIRSRAQLGRLLDNPGHSG